MPTTALRGCALLLLLAMLGAAESDPVVVNACDHGLTFTYLGWKDNVTAADGRIVLKNLSCKGGGGVNGALDLAAQAGRTPALRLTVKPGNTAKGLVLVFSDAGGRSSRFQFALPAPSSEPQVITAKGAVALSHPNLREDKAAPDHPGELDLARISQFQLSGDWSKDALDLELDAVLLLAPDAKMLAEREAYLKTEAEEAAAAAKRAAEEQERLAKQRQDMVRTYTGKREQAPLIVATGLAAPDVIAITVEAQRIVPQTVMAYEAQPGDEKVEEMWADGGVRQAKLKRGGKFVGMLRGRNLDHLSTGEKPEGDPFLEFVADDIANYGITSPDDPAYAAEVKPVALHRKTVPTDAQLPGGLFPTRHRIYLRLPSPVVAGRTYAVRTSAINVRNPDPRFTADFARLPSDSVHVNQIGYRPDDPFKRATLSLWLGSGGGYRFAEGMRFSLVDDAKRQPVFSGTVARVLDVDGTEQLWTKPAKNYAGTAVYAMDFSAFATPGTYRVVVDGVGCSPPVTIAAKAWEHAFLVQMKGLYNNRSGVEIGPPYSDFRKPRDFHPDDGLTITRSTFDVMAKGQFNTKGIPAEDTREPVANAWGGYHDAGDWNPRRVTHMWTTLEQLELAEINPTYFNALDLNIPKTPGLPDIITEALFEIDCFRRLQLPDGGIPFGIESQTDPLAGEMSWLSTQHLYVLAPTMRDSWLYAAVAAQAAKVLRPIDPALAKTYEDSAARAFAWAEADYARHAAAKDLDKLQDLWMAVDARNLSALILYQLSGTKAYHDVFVANTCLKNPGEDLCAWGQHIQTDAAFLYARLDDAKADPQLKKAAVAAIVKLADDSLAYAAGNAFGITQREKGRPMFAGFFSVSGGIELARAHLLTGKREYLLGAVQSCQFQSGCNPNNLVYTTGLGSNPVRHPLHLDSRSSGQPAPIGLTVFGNSDIWNFRGSFWDINLHLVNKPETIWPNAYDWPLSEAYFDVWMLVSANEFVIDTWAQNLFVWGYLASRP